MPAVLFIFVVGIVLGYWLCRMQLRGKFLLAEEMKPLPPPWRPPPLEFAPPTQTQELPLSVAWNLPHHSPPPELVSDNTPHGFSAKQVLGYNVFGYRHEPQYPGGIREWDANVNGIYREEEV